MSRTVARLATPIGLGTALAFVVGTGTGWAYYGGMVRQTGTGSVTPAAATPLTIAATGSVSTGLFPGGPGADVTISVTNPHSVPVRVTAAASGGAVVAVPVSGRTCATHDVTVGTPTSGLPATIAAGATTSITLAGLAKMGMSAATGCQGASFTIPIQVVGTL